MVSLGERVRLLAGDDRDRYLYDPGLWEPAFGYESDGSPRPTIGSSSPGMAGVPSISGDGSGAGGGAFSRIP
jgi:hypothetical protein